MVLGHGAGGTGGLPADGRHRGALATWACEPGPWWGCHTWASVAAMTSVAPPPGLRLGRRARRW